MSTAAIPVSPLRVALVGAPNSGKTTIFNALTGARAKVGNYPGVTVERREGAMRKSARAVSVLDLRVSSTASQTRFSSWSTPPRFSEASRWCSKRSKLMPSFLRRSSSR